MELPGLMISDPKDMAKGFWWLTMFDVENDKFSFIAVQLEFVQSHLISRLEELN